MKRLYLFSIINQYTQPNFHNFLLNSSQGDYKIVVLMQIHQQKTTLQELITLVCPDIDVDKVVFIAPHINDNEAPENTIEHLEQATGIVVLGGNAHFYQKIYGKPEISQLIANKYKSGTPYAGVSAGAILALNYGLLNNIALKPHFSEKKRFNELLTKMRKNKVRYAFGIDDNMTVRIIDDYRYSFYGKDSFYLFERTSTNEYQLKIFKNLDKMTLNLEEE